MSSFSSYKGSSYRDSTVYNHTNHLVHSTYILYFINNRMVARFKK